MFESLKGYISVLTHNTDSTQEPPSEQAVPETEVQDNPKEPDNVSLEASIIDKLNQAKNWTSQVYKKALKSGEDSTQSIAAQLQNQLHSVDVKSVISQLPLLREFQQSQAEFEAEQRRKNLDLTEPNSSSDSACVPPWHPDACGLTDPAAVANLRQRILALSQQPNTFLLAPPDEAQLGSTSTVSAEQWQLAKVLLREDPNLDQMRYKLVPSRISEDLFWRNYFYRITLLSQTAHLAAVAGDTASTESGSQEAGNFVYVEENYDDLPVESSDKDSTTNMEPKSAPRARPSKKKAKSQKPVAPNPVEPPSTDTVQTASETANPAPSVDELLDAELAREVDELVLVSSNDPLSDELDRELELELLAEMDEKET